MNTIQSLYSVTRFKYHDELKDVLLQTIDQEPFTTYGNISKSDWIVPSNYERMYMKLLSPALHEHLKDVYRSLGFNTFTIRNHWMQQYVDGDFHDWHVHEDCNFANVYYIELPDESIGTQFKDPTDLNNVITPTVAEGDIITFPSMIIHRSPVNTTGKRKTVVAFNVSVGY
jgi:hypothetical protein